MNFLVRGHDGTDPEAPARRRAARAAHLTYLDEGKASGQVCYAVATREGDRVTGSTVIYQVNSRADLDELLENEPYVKARVWVTIEVHECGIAPQFVDP